MSAMNERLNVVPKSSQYETRADRKWFAQNTLRYQSCTSTVYERYDHKRGDEISDMKEERLLYDM